MIDLIQLPRQGNGESFTHSLLCYVNEANKKKTAVKFENTFRLITERFKNSQ